MLSWLDEQLSWIRGSIRLRFETDELCLLILVKRQPMASDLRFITLSLKMVTDLERIGDLTVNICERAIDLANVPKLGKLGRSAAYGLDCSGDGWGRN